MLATRAFEALWVTQDWDRAEALLARCHPLDVGEAMLVASVRGQLFQTRAHTDRADDPDYLDAALRHTTDYMCASDLKVCAHTRTHTCMPHRCP